MYSVQVPPNMASQNTEDAVDSLSNDNESSPFSMSEPQQGKDIKGLGIISLPALPTSDQPSTSAQDDVWDGAAKQNIKTEPMDQAKEEKNETLGRSGNTSNHLLEKVNGFPAGAEHTRHDDETDSEELSKEAHVSDHLQELSGNKPHKGPIPHRVDILSDPLLDGDRDRASKKLSASQIHELTSSPESLFLRRLPQTESLNPAPGSSITERLSSPPDWVQLSKRRVDGRDRSGSESVSSSKTMEIRSPPMPFNSPLQERIPNMGPLNGRPGLSSRTTSTPPSTRKSYSSNKATPRPDATTPKTRQDPPMPLPLDAPVFPGRKMSGGNDTVVPDPAPSPMPSSIPLPPLSMPTYLQLELSSSRPSPLYIHRSATSDFPYESSRIKFERLQNFLLVPPNLEGVLWFGALACLDAWLYSFTILPLRFLKALAVLGRWWGQNLLRETQEIALFIYSGLGRMWHRPRFGIDSSSTSIQSPIAARSRQNSDTFNPDQLSKSPAPLPNPDSSVPPSYSDLDRKRKRASKRHRRSKSVPSALLPSHKADLLKGLVVLFSCVILTRFDASRMYHGIRGQAAIKLYVIYNVLEVLSAYSNSIARLTLH